MIIELKNRWSRLTWWQKDCKVHDTDMVRLKMLDKYEFLLRNVRCVFEFRKNLLSIRMFDDIGYYNIFEYGLLKNIAWWMVCG